MIHTVSVGAGNLTPGGEFAPVVVVFNDPDSHYPTLTKPTAWLRPEWAAVHPHHAGIYAYNTGLPEEMLSVMPQVLTAGARQLMVSAENRAVVFGFRPLAHTLTLEQSALCYARLLHDILVASGNFRVLLV